MIISNSAVLRNRSIKPGTSNDPKKKERGLGLVEVVITVGLLGVITAVGAPKLLQAKNQAVDNTAGTFVTSEAKSCATFLLAGGDGANWEASETNTTDIEYTPPTCGLNASFEATGPINDHSISLTDGEVGVLASAPKT